MEMDTVSKNCILTAGVAKRKIRRMAFEIAECNADARSIIIAGITGNGVVVAKNIYDELEQILKTTIDLISININKRQVLEVSIDPEIQFTNKVIIVVDDVANTGRTMLYALKPFLEYQPAKIQTLVLVERSHKLFPVHTDFVGLSVATTLQDHISVETENGTIKGAWLH